ncbi:hypothetical protein [Rhodopseudomonas palustris]|uniref:Glycosyltransferase RgtA/B/C/D-like domain-containing protein n=1 Tax=Rhodopseudomonas palustris (strain BisB18) TaxID=316056 RepID=Q20YS9_RHOPB
MQFATEFEVTTPAHWSRTVARWPVALAALAVLLTVAAKLFMVFTPSEMDSFWIYSWAVNLVDHGIRADRFFYPDDPVGGTHVFQMIPTALVAAIYLVTGHSSTTILLANLLWLSIVFGALYCFLRSDFAWPPVAALTASAVLCLMEPVLRDIVSLRAESISLAMTLIALLLVRRRRLVWLAGVLAVLAVEAHATGVVGATFIALRALRDRPSLERFAALAAGGVGGLLVVWALHPDILSLRWLHALGERQGSNGIRSPLAAYFWFAQYKRHLPELAGLGLGAWLMLRSCGWRGIWSHASEYLLQALIAVCLLELLGRGSYLYVIWIFVPLYFAALRVFPLALAPLLAFHLLNYLALAVHLGGYSHAGLASVLRSMATPQTIVMGQNPVLMGAPTPDQFVWLPDSAGLPPQILATSRPVLVVSRVVRPEVQIDRKFGEFYIGWLRGKPSP